MKWGGSIDPRLCKNRVELLEEEKEELNGKIRKHEAEYDSVCWDMGSLAWWRYQVYKIDMEIMEWKKQGSGIK